MGPPWGNGIGDYLVLLAVIIVAIVIGTRIVRQWHARVAPSAWAIAYGVGVLIVLIVFNIWFYFLRY